MIFQWMKKQKEEKLQKAKMWHETMAMLGHHTNLKELEKIALSEPVSSELIPYRALFTFPDMCFITSFHTDNGSGAIHMSLINRKRFPFANIESAVHAKKLIGYIEKTRDAIERLGTPETIQYASSSIENKWNSLRYEEKKAVAELKRITSRDYDGIIHFSKNKILPDNEVLELIEEKLKEGKPVMKTLIGSTEEEIVTSPALVDLNRFLNENALPDDVEKQLKNTIDQIEQQLRNEQVVEDESEIRMQAEFITKAAKDYHQLNTN